MESNETEQIQERISALLDDIGIDGYVFNAPINRITVGELLEIARCRLPRREKVGLFIATSGGDPDAAYLLMQGLRRCYAHVAIYIMGWCKSAGTLAALGAHEVVMGDDGELGPLDIQVMQTDELGRQSSGLTIFETLEELSGQAFKIYEVSMLEITRRSFGSVTFKTASELALQIVDSIISPIARQVDPDRLGEMRRAIRIAHEYGRMLHANPIALVTLTHGYPSHSFVIDREEASDVLDTVRDLTPAENELVRLLDTLLSDSGFPGALRNPTRETLVISLQLPDDADSYRKQDVSNALNEQGQAQSNPSEPTPAGDAPTEEQVVRADEVGPSGGEDVLDEGEGAA